MLLRPVEMRFAYRDGFAVPSPDAYETLLWDVMNGDATLGLLAVSRFLVDYPFAKRLYPKALEVIAHVKKWGSAVLFTDGDVVFQPRKVERSGLYEAVDRHALIYVHKEAELADVEARHPAARYVVVDDKLAILAAIKKVWKARATTIFVRQGHYALDPEILANSPPADISLESIGDLLGHDSTTLALPSRQIG